MPEITTTPPVIPSSAPAPAPAAAKAPAALPGKTTGNPAPGTRATVDIDAEDLGKWAGLGRNLREVRGKLTASEAKLVEYEKKISELEGLRPVADKGGNVERLVKEGKHLEAMKAAGADLEAAFAQWVADNDGAAAPTAPPKELIELQARFDALEAKAKAEDEAKGKETEAEKVAAFEAGKQAVVKDLSDKIASDSKRWARCGKEPAEAANDALQVAVEKVKALGRNVTDAEAVELYDKALDQVEAGYKALAEKFYIAEAPRVRPTSIAQVTDYLRARESSPVAERKPAVTLDGQRGSLRSPATETKGKLTEAEAKAKALASIRSMKRAG